MEKNRVEMLPVGLEKRTYLLNTWGASQLSERFVWWAPVYRLLALLKAAKEFTNSEDYDLRGRFPDQGKASVVLLCLPLLEVPVAYMQA